MMLWNALAFIITLYIKAKKANDRMISTDLHLVKSSFTLSSFKNDDNG